MAVKNLKNEALSLVKGLTKSEKYRLYEIALTEKSKARSPERENEMNAVLNVLEEDRSLEISTLVTLRKNKSEMSSSITKGELKRNAKKTIKKQ